MVRAQSSHVVPLDLVPYRWMAGTITVDRLPAGIVLFACVGSLVRWTIRLPCAARYLLIDLFAAKRKPRADDSRDDIADLQASRRGTDSAGRVVLAARKQGQLRSKPDVSAPH